MDPVEWSFPAEGADSHPRGDAKSLARIHLANLINFGIVPLTIKEKDYWKVKQEDGIEINAGDLRKTVTLVNKTKNEKIFLAVPLNKRGKSLMRRGGALAYVERKSKESN